MNATATSSASWDLLLNRPYDDGGGENSSRVNGAAGWDDFANPYAPLANAAAVRTASDGVLNDPTRPPTQWTATLKLPLAKLVEGTTATAPPVPGSFWRINFSRVEWALKVVNGVYQKFPSCQSCPTPGAPNEDNWAWSPQGSIAMHLPERWGMLQFSDAAVNTTAPVFNAEWPSRAMAVAAYYAQKNYSSAHNGSYAGSVADLLAFTPTPEALDGTCGATGIALSPDASTFNVSVVDPAANFVATIRNDRYLTVVPF